MATKLQTRDRQEWLSKLMARVKREKVVSITLNPKGITFDDLKRAMAGFAVEQSEGKVRIAVIQKT